MHAEDSLPCKDQECFSMYLIHHELESNSYSEFCLTTDMLCTVWATLNPVYHNLLLVSLVGQEPCNLHMGSSVSMSSRALLEQQFTAKQAWATFCWTGVQCTHSTYSGVHIHAYKRSRFKQPKTSRLIGRCCSMSDSPYRQAKQVNSSACWNFFRTVARE